MARGTQLGTLIEDLRAEAGHSLQLSLGKQTRDILINLIQRTQRRLWNDYDWPFLKIKRSIEVQAGQRYYDIPDDLTFERIRFMEFKYGNNWIPVQYGINRSHYNQFDSDQGIRSWPVERYDAYENNQLEVWPIPSLNANSTTLDGMIRVWGIRNLSPLIAESDTADLDDQLLVLYAAGELLTRQKQADAQAKLAQAQAHYQRLKARSAKTETFVISGGEPMDAYTPRGSRPIAVVPTPTS